MTVPRPTPEPGHRRITALDPAAGRTRPCEKTRLMIHGRASSAKPALAAALQNREGLPPSS